MVTKSKVTMNVDNAGKRSETPSSDVNDSERSTMTRANGGTRSSPPRVGGTGGGEARDVKAGSAAEARRSTAKTDDIKSKADASGD